MSDSSSPTKAKTVGEWLQRSEAGLGAGGIGTARLDSLLMLEKATGRDRAWLLAHDEEALQPETHKLLRAWYDRRLGHEPLTYIFEEVAFYGRRFTVNHDVLVPRPESETMIELLKRIEIRHSLSLQGTLLDVGTGSGALAVTAALEFPGLQVFGSDIDPAALRVATANDEALGTGVTFFQADLLSSGRHEPFDFILANLPYVPQAYRINESAEYEPRHAIFGGHDGLDLYRTMFKQLGLADWKPQVILTESLPFQHLDLQKTALRFNFVQIDEADFVQAFAPAA